METFKELATRAQVSGLIIERGLNNGAPGAWYSIESATNLLIVTNDLRNISQHLTWLESLSFNAFCHQVA